MSYRPLSEYFTKTFWNDLIIRAGEKLPDFIAALLVLVLTYFIAKKVAEISDKLISNKFKSKLLSRMVAKLVALPVVLAGIYIILRIFGLTQLALTILGGTGVLGLILGIAFKDITENFLASILISLQRPFKLGDLISIDEHHGYVQAVTTRGTIILTLEGNHVQIPNAIVYKASVVNFSANPQTRIDFAVGIGYDNDLAAVQALALQAVLGLDPALKSPEPLVLIEKLGSATINIRIYVWINTQKHSIYKVKSSAIKNVVETFLNHNISMPDDAREILFSNSLDVNYHKIKEKDQQDGQAEKIKTSEASKDNLKVKLPKEKLIQEDFSSEALIVEQQGQKAKLEGQEDSLV